MLKEGGFIPVATVQIPPSTTYAVTPLKRPMEEDGEEKSPSKKKKKIQKKGIELTRGRCKGDAQGGNGDGGTSGRILPSWKRGAPGLWVWEVKP